MIEMILFVAVVNGSPMHIEPVQHDSTMVVMEMEDVKKKKKKKGKKLSEKGKKKKKGFWSKMFGDK